MSFEISDRDMLARLGKIKTKSGTIETPLLLPVINPSIQPISPKTMKDEFGCQALITNAYILKKQHGEEIAEQGIHEFLDFDGVIMTDSGAYQILVYGGVEVTPEEIVQYQERISSDIATILDIPTSWHTTKEHAKQTVKETIKRAKRLAKVKTRDDVLWVAPVQGGRYLDLVAHSAKQVGTLPFQVHALGSPTTVMEQYLFDVLVDMILTAKTNLPLQRPLHLFGAGHPFMFALAVALGCDMFDSAAYAIFARENRYLTEYGTSRLGELEYFPCSCPVCAKSNPEDLADMPMKERHEALAKHNLYVSFAELRRVKQAILEGRLWEYLETRAHAHPALLQAVKHLKKYENYIEEQSPVTKRSGLFFFSSVGLARPEIVHYKKRLNQRYSHPSEAKVLLLLPRPSRRPFHKAVEVRGLVEDIQKLRGKADVVHICVYAAPFGVTPLELDEIYPLSQHEIAMPLDIETIDYVVEQIRDYIASSSYQKVILIQDENDWKDKIVAACKHIRRKDLSITYLSVKGTWKDKVLNHVVESLQEFDV